MKIKCDFCETMFNDTLENCPHCGAPSKGVKRSVDNQPTTIEGLKQWYADRGLPPYDVTRFFIGENYKEPRAFGIYFDEKTHNYVVYKNKDNGERAVRYEGTDEAYAVNELFQRLKQEILQQKSNNLKKTGSLNGSNSGASKVKSGLLAGLFGGATFLVRLIICGIIFGAMSIGMIMVVGAFIIFTEPKTGYYDYYNEYYYYNSDTYANMNWYVYESKNDEWLGMLTENSPDEFRKKSTANRFFISKEWKDKMDCSSYDDTIFVDDIKAGEYINTGYFKVEDYCYYHYDADIDGRWFAFDPDYGWFKLDFIDLPYELQHTSIISDYFVSKDLVDDYGATNFLESVAYQDMQVDSNIQKGYYLVDDALYYHLADDYEEGWYEYSDTSDNWRAINKESLPEDLTHPSYAEDFYYTPDWDSSAQITEFTGTSLYEQDKDNWNSNYNSSDSGSDSYDWGSSDSWDSGGSDWGSDW